jgi:type I restriction enzyme, S subunit
METLGKLCQFLNGGTPSKAVASYFEGDIPWITSADMTGPIANFARSFITLEAIKASATNKVPKGTILLVTRTGVGKVAVAGSELCFSQDITAIIPDETKLDTNYLVQYLRTKQAHFERFSRGATIKGITRDVVADLAIRLPALAEQRRIAAILDQADALRAKRRETLAQLDKLTQAIFVELFGEPVTNPMNWPASTKLGELTDIVSGITKGRDALGKAVRSSNSQFKHL